MGCKGFWEMSKRKDQFDLIETYWDVKISVLDNWIRISSDLIETYWDVKMTEKDFKIEKIKI